MKPAQKAIIALIIANVIWGAASPIFKIALENIPPLTLAFWRFFLGAFIILTVYGKRAGAAGTLLKNDLPLIIFSAFSGITVNIIFYFLGLNLTLAINASVIAAGGPIFTMVLADLFLHERFYLRKFIGMILGSLGIFVIVIEPLIYKGLDGSIIGNLFLVIATIGAVGQTINNKKLLRKYDSILVTFWSFFFGALSFLPFAVREYIQNPLIYQQLDWRGYTGIFFGSILSSALAYCLYAWGLARIEATDTSMFTYIMPVVGTILSYFLLNEPITYPFIIGSILIIMAIVVAESRIRRFVHHKIVHPHKRRLFYIIKNRRFPRYRTSS